MSEDVLNLPEVNRTWLESVLLETFATTRHHITGNGNKAKAKYFIVNHFKELQLTVQYDEFVSENQKVICFTNNKYFH